MAFTYFRIKSKVPDKTGATTFPRRGYPPPPLPTLPSPANIVARSANMSNPNGALTQVWLRILTKYVPFICARHNEFLDVCAHFRADAVTKACVCCWTAPFVSSHGACSALPAGVCGLVSVTSQFLQLSHGRC